MTKAFDAFQEYVALKMHLTSDYDYVKFEGRTTLKESSLEKRNDRRFFEKLAHRQKRDVHGFLVAQLSHDPRLWVGNLLGAEAEGRYMSWKRTQESLTYTFRSELNLLKQDHLDHRQAHQVQPPLEPQPLGRPDLGGRQVQGAEVPCALPVGRERHEDVRGADVHAREHLMPYLFDKALEERDALLLELSEAQQEILELELEIEELDDQVTMSDALFSLRFLRELEEQEKC